MPPNIPTPIVDLVLHPPLGLLKRELITGTFTGSGDLTRSTGALPPFDNVNAYGLTWDIFSISDTIGFTLGSPVVYERRVCQLSTVHRGYDGHDLVSEYHEFAAEGLYWLWDNPGPQRVHYEIPSNVVLVLYWLIIQFP